MNFGHVWEPFLHFSADTKQTRVLHYVSVREEEKGSVFKGPHKSTECQNSGLPRDLTYSLNSEISTYKNKSEIAQFAHFIYLAYFIFVCIKLQKITFVYFLHIFERDNFVFIVASIIITER